MIVSDVDRMTRLHAPSRLVVVLALVAALVLGSMSVASSAGATPADGEVVSGQARATALVPPTSFGPYKVGRQVIQIRSRTGRSRTVDVWYPADAKATGRLSVYSNPSFGGLSFSGRSLDRVPVAKGGPFPMVVYSHGSGGVRFVASTFTETLASHGFVVISADHTGDTVMDVLAGRGASAATQPQVIANRVADVRMIVTGILTRSATRGDLLYRSVDPRRIGITGHSYGGLTAFAAVAGKEAYDDNVAIPRDNRFKAIVTMDATPGLLLPEALERVRVPTLSIAGDGLPPGGASFWYQTKASPLLDLRIDRAHHNSFTDICLLKRIARRFPDAPRALVGLVNATADSACYRPNLGSERVHLLTNRYAVAFLLRHLAGDERYGSYLTPRTDAEATLTAPEPISIQPLPPIIVLD